MNESLNPEKNSLPILNSGIGQQVENSQVHGGIQATQGDKNVQVHGEGNVLTFNQTEILQITEREITSRELIKTSPYKGLEIFKSTDKELFFGRDNFIKNLVNELEKTNLVLLLGASGSGKSSVVRAGLIPWLEKKYGTGLINFIFNPDADPFDSFYSSLRSNYSQAEAKMAREVKADTLTKVVQNLKKDDEFWFILIDQFEELFISSDENRRREFITGLVQLSQANLPNVNHNFKIMGTMRADFFERLEKFPELVEVTQKHRPMIVEMQPNELRLAIEQPAAHHGVVFEAGLVDTIIADIQGQAGYLPLLQYTLNLVWKDEVKTGSINDRTLNISTYQNLGGVQGALQQHVNDIYEKFSEPEKLATQRIFLKLVEIGENTESGMEWKPVRRRAFLSEFGEDERDVLLKLVDENLLVSNAEVSGTSSQKGFLGLSKSRKSVKSNSTIEITHEVLLTSWDKLNYWIKKNRKGIALRNRLYEDVRRWQEKKPEEELWTGSKLEQILELKKDENFNQVLGGFDNEANQFIDASVGLRDRNLRRTRIFAGIGFTLAGLASVASVFAFVQQQDSQEKSIISLTQTVESRLLANNQLDAMVAAIKAKKELKNLWIAKDRVSLRVLGSLGQAVHHNQTGWRERLRLPGKDVIFSPNGEVLATRDDQTVQLWDVLTGKPLQTLTGHENLVLKVVYSPNGEQLATVSDDKTARLWSAATGHLLHTLKVDKTLASSVVFSPDGKKLATALSNGTVQLWDTKIGKQLNTFTGHKSPVDNLVFSPDGKQLATAAGITADPTVLLWDVKTGQLIHTLTGHENSLNTIVFSPDGKQLATASADQTARLWDTTAGKQLQILTRHESIVNTIVFSPDGKQLATASDDKTARLWDTTTGKLIQTLIGHESIVNTIVFSPDGKQLATASDDKTARLWDTTTGKLIQTFAGHKISVISVEFSPDGKQIATASGNQTVRLWDTTTSKLVQTLTGHKMSVISVEISPDGKQLATASADQTVRLWDATTGRLLQTLTGHEHWVNNVEFSPNGKQLATTSHDYTARLWDTTTGKLLQTLTGYKKNPVTKAVFSPDGKQLVTASWDATVKLWDATTGQSLQTLTGHNSSVNSAVFSPNGKQLATASADQTVRLWDATTGKPLQILTGYDRSVDSAVFSPNGKQLATASLDGTIKLWNAKTGTLLWSVNEHKNWVHSVEFSPNGKQLATASADKTARLWDVKTGKLLQTFTGHENSVWNAEFSPDGKQLATASVDTTARLWDVKTGKLLQTFTRHRNVVSKVVFSPDGNQLATASRDGTARLWRVGSIEHLLAVNCDWVRYYLENSPDVEESDRSLCDDVPSFEAVERK